MILLNLSFFPATSISAALKEYNLNSAHEFQKRAIINDDVTKQKIDLNNKDLEALKEKTIEGQSLTSKTQSKKLNLEKGLQNNKQEKLNYVPGEILVKYKKDKINLETFSGQATALNFIRTKSMEKKKDIRESNVSVLKTKSDESVESMIEKLKNDPNVEYVQPNFQYYPLSIDSDDTYKGLLWGIDNTGQEVNSVSGTPDADIDAPEAWLISEGNKNDVIIAVIDDGVAYNHPDLSANMWDGIACVGEDIDGNQINGGCQHGYDYEDNDKTPLPTSGSHGTHIAGTIAAVKNNNEGIIGVAPNAKIMALKSSLTTDEIVKAISFAENNGAKIVNASWGGSNFDQALKDAIDSFSGLFIAAAGNESINNELTHIYPSDYDLDNIISVAATDQNDVLASFSSYGATSVDVGAPGENIYSTVTSEIISNIINEPFSGISTFSAPNGWVATNYWGVFNTGVEYWDEVLYGDVYNIPYENNVNSTITLPSYNLNYATTATIDFWSGCDTEYTTTDWYDYMTLELSSDDVNYDTVLIWDEAYLDFLNEESPLDDSGMSIYHFQDLEIPNEYLTSNFKLRFRWVTDSSNVPDLNYDGCFIDDLKITTYSYSDGSDERYDYMQGTSMAAPHAAGLAGLIWGYKPELSYSQVKDVILSTGDDIASLAGKTVTGKRINALNALNSLASPIISDVQTATTTPNSTFVIWSTDKLATSKVAYSTTTPVSSTIVSDDTLVTNHSIELTGLTANTIYYFYTESTDEFGNTATSTEQSFTTPAIPDTEAPVLIEVTPVPVLTNDNTPDYTFNSSEAGTINYEGLCESLTTEAIVGDNTITFNVLNDNPYSDCVITVTDTAGNTSDPLNVSTFTINTIPPEINLNGDQIINLIVGDDYNELGATATDDMEGDLTALIITAGDTVNTSIAGTYAVTYNVSDSVGNAAEQVVRTIIVSEAPDETPPVITLLGTSLVTLEVGTAYTDTGATASDDVDGDISASIVTGGDIVNINTLGTYTITYNVSDLSGNPAAEITRTVNIVDTTAPVITLLGDNPATHEVGTTYNDAGATANDNYNGNITANIVTVNPVDLNTLGTYTVTYNITDSSGNVATEVTRTVNVVDTTAPVITLLGENPITIPVNTVYEDAGATALDNYDGDLTTDIVTVNLVDTANVGAYQISYNITDYAGNPATEAIRTVNVVDISAPIITLLGDNTITVEVDSEYTDAGAIAIDDVDGDISNDIVIINNVDINTVGSYSITYNVTDSSGNQAPEVVRTVNVVDNMAPVITLLGDNPVSIEVGYQYIDAGAIASDNYDGDITDSIVVVNNVDYNTVGVYTVIYNVNDTSDNPADEITRTVNVTTDNTLPVITLNGGNVVIYEGVNYEDAHATAFDNIDGDITEDIVVTDLETVDANTPGTYTINYNVADGSGNSATEVSRTVTVLVLEDNQIALTSNITINASSTEVMIGSDVPNNSTISIPSTINNANLNLSALMNGTDATFATGLTINSETSIGEVNVQIPQNTLISGEAGWEGVVNLPQIQENSSITVTPDSGYSASVSSVLEIGYGDVALTFDQAVRIKLTGQAGKYIGYSRNDIFTPITATCSADSQAAGNALTAGGDCKIDVGSDLIIWTKHFTKFATYTQTAIPVPAAPPASSGGGGGGGSVSTDTSAPTNTSIIINSGATTTTSRTVILTLSASDSSSIQMAISNNSDFSVGSWENYSTSKTWQLTGENGVKTVYVKFKDIAGNVSNTIYDTITLSLPISDEVEEIEEDVKVLGIEHNITSDVNCIIEETIKKEKEAMTEININLSKRLNGRILLQVEERGEAWYVNPKDNNKYYMANGNEAYSIMRYLSIGITNKDLERVMADEEFAKKHSGKIFLQVEEHGEAFYIDMDGNAHYLKDGLVAYAIMRELGLGITNDDLRKIEVGEIKEGE